MNNQATIGDGALDNRTTPTPVANFARSVLAIAAVPRSTAMRPTVVVVSKDIDFVDLVKTLQPFSPREKARRR